MQKLYCYVDETGQDTEGKYFVVSVVAVADNLHDDLNQIITDIEKKTGKHKKWTDTHDELNLVYIRHVMQKSSEIASHYFEVHQDTKDYLAATFRTIQAAIQHFSARHEPSKAVVIVDGLPKTHEQKMTTTLRKNGSAVYKVRGQSDDFAPLLRLADAICGLKRDADEGKISAQRVLSVALKQMYIEEISR